MKVFKFATMCLEPFQELTMSRKRGEQSAFNLFVFSMKLRLPMLQPRAFCPQPCSLLFDAHDVPLALDSVLRWLRSYPGH